MNKPSSTITAAAVAGAITTIAFILLAIISPEAYGRIPPGGSETIVTSVMTIFGYFKKENVLK